MSVKLTLQLSYKLPYLIQCPTRVSTHNILDFYPIGIHSLLLAVMKYLNPAHTKEMGLTLNGMKQLVSKVANILEKLQNLWKWEIWGNIVKIWYFVNNFLIEARIQKFFCTCVTHIMVIIWSTAHYVSI